MGAGHRAPLAMLSFANNSRSTERAARTFHLAHSHQAPFVFLECASISIGLGVRRNARVNTICGAVLHLNERAVWYALYAVTFTDCRESLGVWTGPLIASSVRIVSGRAEAGGLVDRQATR